MELIIIHLGREFEYNTLLLEAIMAILYIMPW